MIRTKLVYKDGKDVIVSVNEEEFGELFSCLSKGQVFWNSNQKAGFWTSFDNIRFIQFERNEELNELKQNNPSDESDQASL